MPGFFMTFMMLMVAAAWSRYVASTKGPAWLIWITAPGLLLWLLTFVYAAASLSAAGPEGAGLASDAASKLAVDAMAERLTRVRLAAGIGQWSAIGTLVATVVVSIWAFLRPHGAQEAR